MTAFADSYRGKKVLVTGCTGFKGSWLCVWLRELGAEVSGLALAPASEPSMFGVLKLAQQIQFFEGDIRNAAWVREVVERVQPDVVFHLAAQAIVKTSYEDPVATFATNVMGTAHVLDALRVLQRPVRAVMITSDKCYENVEWTFGYRENDALGGKDPYSASKAAAEMAIRAWHQSYFKAEHSHVQIVSARAGNVIGGGDWAEARIVPDCVRAWSQGQAVTIRSPNATRPWQHVLEPLSGYLCAGVALTENPKLNGEAFNFGPAAEQNQSVYQLLLALAGHWSTAQVSPEGDMEKQRTDAEFDAERFVKIEPAPFHEAGLLKLSCDKALYYLHWRPTLDFAQTAELTAHWFNAYYQRPGTDMLALTQAQLANYVAKAHGRGVAWAQR